MVGRSDSSRFCFVESFTVFFSHVVCVCMCVPVCACVCLHDCVCQGSVCLEGEWGEGYLCFLCVCVCACLYGCSCNLRLCLWLEGLAISSPHNSGYSLPVPSFIIVIGIKISLPPNTDVLVVTTYGVCAEEGERGWGSPERVQHNQLYHWHV